MSYFTSPKIVTDNLAMYIDAGNSKSYKGEATVNLINPSWSAWGLDSSGYSTGGTRTITSGNPYECTIVDSGANTRQSISTGASANTTYTFSVFYKKIYGTPTLRFQLQAWNSGTYVSTMIFATTAQLGVTDIDGWQRAQISVTTPANCNSVLWFMQDGDDYTGYTHAFMLANPQMEQKSYATQFVAGTRGTTVATGGGFYDLSGNSNHCTVTSTGISTVSTYGGGVACDGSSGYIELPTINNGINRSVDIVYRQINLNGGWGPLWRNDWRERIFTTSSTIINAPGTYYSIAGPVGDTNMVQICYTIDGLTLSSYRNGSLLSTDTMGGYMNQGAYSYRFGYQCGGATCTNVAVEIYSVKFYNKGLTSSEVLQNFNATKRRYGL